MFGANAFGWPYFGQCYAGVITTPVVTAVKAFATVAASQLNVAAVAASELAVATVAAAELTLTTVGAS